MSSVAVLDYGGSNLRSVAKAVEHVAPAGTRVIVSDSSAELSAADRLVFPGQGACGQCMNSLRARGLDDVLREYVASGKPMFGICLGLQTLMSDSDEDGGVQALGLIDGNVERFEADPPDTPVGKRRKIPHMGWNLLSERHEHPIWKDVPEDARFYFVHSYYVVPSDDSVIAARTDYGVRFVSAIAHNNLFATQFHPEKSQQHGLKLLENFFRWEP